MSEPDSAPAAQGQFVTTHWSVVLAAADSSVPTAQPALEHLCRAYWYPLYAFVRRRGYGPEDSQDLTQSFFARLLERDYVKRADRERGKFRTFLLTALSHFLPDQWARAPRLKRGGAHQFIPIDAATAEERYRLEPADPADPAKLFERRWATTLLERALAELEREYQGRGQGEMFDALRAFLLAEQGDTTYLDAAPRVGMTAAAMKMAVSRMRGRCRELLRHEILQTAAGPVETQEGNQGIPRVLPRKGRLLFSTFAAEQRVG